MFGFTGDYAYFDPAISWFLAGKKPDELPTNEKAHWSLLVFMRDSVDRYTNDLPYPESFPYPQAFGSGAVYAQTALALGKSPAEAVAVAATFNVYTDGPIQVVNIAEALGRQQFKEAAE